jgi:hypothetical protein
VDFDWDADTRFVEANTLFPFEVIDPRLTLVVQLPKDMVVTRSTLMLQVDRADQQEAALTALHRSTLETSMGHCGFWDARVSVEAAAVFWDAIQGQANCTSALTTFQLPVVGYYARRHSRVVSSSPHTCGDGTGLWVEGPCPLNMQFCIGGVCGSRLRLRFVDDCPLPEGCRVYLRCDVAYMCELRAESLAADVTCLTRVPCQDVFGWHNSVSTTTYSGRYAVSIDLTKVCAVAIWTGDDHAVDNVAFELMDGHATPKVVVPFTRHEGSHVFLPAASPAGEPGGHADLLDSLVVHKCCVPAGRFESCVLVFDVLHATGQVHLACLDLNMSVTILSGEGFMQGQSFSKSSDRIVTSMEPVDRVMR